MRCTKLKRCQSVPARAPENSMQNHPSLSRPRRQWLIPRPRKQRHGYKDNTVSMLLIVSKTSETSTCCLLETYYCEVVSDARSVQELLAKCALDWSDGLFLSGKHSLCRCANSPHLFAPGNPHLFEATKECLLVSEPCQTNRD